MNPRAIVIASAADAKLVMRDPLLAILPIAPFLAAGAIRFLLPTLDAFLAPLGFGFLGGYAAFIRATLINFPGMFYGMMAGFLILEDRDEGILRYQEATPLGRAGYLGVRIGFFSLLALVSGPLVGLASGIGTYSPADLVVSVLGAFQVPFMALCLSAFAANKVEGLSMAKALGILGLAPLALAASGPLRWVGAPFFQYWGVSLLFAPSGPTAGLPFSLPVTMRFGIGALVALGQLVALYGIFKRRTE